MDETQTAEHDPNDPRVISFTIDKESSAWVDKAIERLDNYDPGFYVRIIGIEDNYLYKISTTQKHLEHEEAKKFLFQLELRFGRTLKIR